tara:strand:- start:759 stop:1082 length:324 start_codon:yes stop_codon:yes gene_type:complete
MEEQIKTAKETRSWSGLACKIISIIGILGTIVYAVGFVSRGINKNIYFWSIIGTSLGSSVSIGALGSIADSAKKNKALTLLLVESTNSASQLPLTKEIEYSDLNEDN